MRAWCFRTFTGGFGKSGVPDLIACVPVRITPAMVGMTIGVFVSVEVKREGKNPTVIQERRMEEIGESAGFTLWGTSEKVISELRVWIARFQ